MFDFSLQFRQTIFPRKSHRKMRPILTQPFLRHWSIRNQFPAPHYAAWTIQALSLTSIHQLLSNLQLLLNLLMIVSTMLGVEVRPTNNNKSHYSQGSQSQCVTKHISSCFERDTNWRYIRTNSINIQFYSHFCNMIGHLLFPTVTTKK